jgi:hypothetical protein
MFQPSNSETFQKIEMLQSTAESANACSISARFRLFNSIVVVLANGADNEALPLFTTNGKPIRYVTLGSIQHLDAVNQRVSELTMLARDTKLETELELKRQEAIFLRSNCDIPQEKIESDGVNLSKEETMGNKSLIIDDLLDNTIIHATSENFGDLKRIRLIEIKDKQPSFFKVPSARQYYIDKVLHREEHERRVTWYELFTDLIVIGAIGKSKYLVTYSWFSYFQFLLVFSCIAAHWTTTMT